VLGFGPARVLLLLTGVLCLIFSHHDFQTFSFNSTGSSGLYTSVRARFVRLQQKSHFSSSHIYSAGIGGSIATQKSYSSLRTNQY
jgi:hypothetical protein